MNKLQEFLAGTGFILVCLFGTAVDGPNWHIAVFVMLFGLLLMLIAILIDFTKHKKENNR